MASLSCAYDTMMIPETKQVHLVVKIHVPLGYTHPHYLTAPPRVNDLSRQM